MQVLGSHWVCLADTNSCAPQEDCFKTLAYAMAGRVTLDCMWPATASEDSADEWSPGSTVPWLRGAYLILWGRLTHESLHRKYCFHCHKSVWNHHPFLLRFLKCNMALKSKKLFLFYNEIHIFFTLGVCNMPAIRSSKHKTNKTRVEGTGRGAVCKVYYLLLQEHQTKQGPKPILLTDRSHSVPQSVPESRNHIY